ncbi:MAG TPA: FliA/WhiG family RNA polymerase sigma factor [Longimicrobiales bacterium]|nr:FliA/WhiG family RNA polymerase sigma factor [Longimicrobiales bacterium]
MRTDTVMEQNDWAAFRQQGDQRARERLIERHIPLVRYFARRMEPTAAASLSRDELESAGTLGLLNAVDAFDPDRGYRFSTFAAPRIRGAMLDELRRRDPASRAVRRRQREVADVENRLAVRLERLPRHDEVAATLGVDPGTLWGWKDDAQRSRGVSLDSGVREDGGGALMLREVLLSEDWEDPEERVAARQEAERLRAELETLDERERLVLRLHDFQEMKMREIASILKVTESRVSQIRTRALNRLRDRMGDLREVAA